MIRLIKVRKKPIIVRAFQLTESMITSAELNDYPNISMSSTGSNHYYFVVFTLEGKMRAEIGDWIIIGVEGELYPCKKSIFEKTYEEVVVDAKI